MIRFEVAADDLLRSRFALSPLFELDCLLRILSRPGRKRPWLERLVPVFRELRRESDVDAVLALLPPRYGPGFIAPPPRTLAQTIEDDLSTVRATPLAQARREMRISLDLQPGRPAGRVEAVLRSRQAVSLLADALERAWYALLAPDWLRLRAILERDVVHRAGVLGRAGWAAAFAGLHPRLRWRDGGLEVMRSAPDRTIPLTGTGLLLIPSVFVWPQIATHTEEPWPKSIIYPARGVAALWEQPAARPDAALADLIGRTRAAILTTLSEPASTTQLARALGLGTGAVGDHLAVLTRAGLLDSARAGRSVLYRRTALGDALAPPG